jgi:serine/threonine protein kinase
VKVLRTLNAGAEAAARFRREGMTACRVQHPNALAVLDLDVTQDGIPFLVMELLEGHTLEDEMNGQLLPLARCAAVLAPVCDALEAAHVAGIVHRDIKPANIFIHNGPAGEIPKILDFGIAKLIGGDDERVTRDGSFVGTPTYMAPERFRSGECGGRSDVYAVALVLHQALTGSLPYSGGSSMVHPDPMAMAVMHMLDPPIPLREARPDLPAELEQLILAGLSKAPDERPSAAGLASTLRALAERWGASEAPRPTLRAPARLAPTLCVPQPDTTLTRSVGTPKSDAGEGGSR